MATNANPPRGAFGPAPKAKQPTVPEGLGVFGALRQPDERYLFGTDDEIRDRNATGYILGGTPPENAAPSFVQIRPGPTSKVLNEPPTESRKGDSKFGKPRRYVQAMSPDMLAGGMPGGPPGAGAPMGAPPGAGAPDPAMLLAQLMRRSGKKGPKGKRRGKRKQMAVPQKLHETGQRREFGGEGGPEDKPAAMPKEDAHANKTFFGPAGLAKGAGSGRNKTSLVINAPQVSQSASAFQKARRRK